MRTSTASRAQPAGGADRGPPARRRAVERGRVEACDGAEAAIAREAAKGEATVAAAAAATEAAAGERLDARAGAAAERAVAAAWDASKRAPASWRGPRSPPRRRRRARSFSAG